MMIQNKRIFASILFVLIGCSCMAQHMPPPSVPPPGLPIDAGVFLGLAVGLFYGGKKLLNKRR